MVTSETIQAIKALRLLIQRLETLGNAVLPEGSTTGTIVAWAVGKQVRSVVLEAAALAEINTELEALKSDLVATPFRFVVGTPTTTVAAQKPAVLLATGESEVLAWLSRPCVELECGLYWVDTAHADDGVFALAATPEHARRMVAAHFKGKGLDDVTDIDMRYVDNGVFCE